MSLQALVVDGLLVANWSASRRGARAGEAVAANTQALFDALPKEAKQRAYEIQQQREHQFDERKWFARKCAAIGIIALLLIGGIANFAKAAEIDLTPRAGETTREYQARISGDPARLEAVKQNIQQEQQAADDLAARQQAAYEQSRHNRAMEYYSAESNALYKYSIDSTNAYRNYTSRPRCNPLSPRCNP